MPAGKERRGAKARTGAEGWDSRLISRFFLKLLVLELERVGECKRVVSKGGGPEMPPYGITPIRLK